MSPDAVFLVDSSTLGYIQTVSGGCGAHTLEQLSVLLFGSCTTFVCVFYENVYIFVKPPKFFSLFFVKYNPYVVYLAKEPRVIFPKVGWQNFSRCMYISGYIQYVIKLIQLSFGVARDFWSSENFKK